MKKALQSLMRQISTSTQVDDLKYCWQQIQKFIKEFDQQKRYEGDLIDLLLTQQQRITKA